MIFRKLESKNNWRRDALYQSKVAPADTLNCLRSKACKLSFYRADDPASINIIAAGIAATRDNLQEIDYALVEERLIEALGVRLITCAGQTPSSKANSLHLDAVELSAAHVAAIATVFFEHAQFARIGKKDIESLIRAGVERADIDREKLKIKLSS